MADSTPNPTPAASPEGLDLEQLPPLFADRSFWGMTVTQLLGAFNDNVFKQSVLLICAAVLVAGVPQDRQPWAQAVFALPFVLFSGIAGYWCDRVSKRSVVVCCKVAEIAVMALATVAFLTLPERQPAPQGQHAVISAMPWFLLVVLFLMGTQSAVFGPAKYGILPEMVRKRDLPAFNGVIQMTTFIAIILGTWLGGLLLDLFGGQGGQGVSNDHLWKIGAVCVAIAAAGTATSLLVRHTPVAQPNAPFHWSAVVLAPETRQVLGADPPLRRALVVYCLVWFVAAVFPMAVNSLGLYYYELSYEQTSRLLAFISIGLAVGFVAGAWLSGPLVRFDLVRWGGWGLVACMLVLSVPVARQQAPLPQAPAAAQPGAGQAPAEQAPAAKKDAAAKQPASITRWRPWLGSSESLWAPAVVMALIGFFAGLFCLPVQVFLQARPPRQLKGRVIGSMNLINWTAILLAAGYYSLLEAMLRSLQLPYFFIFGISALWLLPVVLLYRTDRVQADQVELPWTPVGQMD